MSEMAWQPARIRDVHGLWGELPSVIQEMEKSVVRIGKIDSDPSRTKIGTDCPTIAVICPEDGTRLRLIGARDFRLCEHEILTD